MGFSPPHPRVHLWLNDDGFCTITPGIGQGAIQVRLEFARGYVCSRAFVVHNHGGMRELGAQNVQYLNATPANTTVAALLNENSEVDLANSQRLVTSECAA